MLVNEVATASLSCGMAGDHMSHSTGVSDTDESNDSANSVTVVDGGAEMFEIGIDPIHDDVSLMMPKASLLVDVHCKNEEIGTRIDTLGDVDPTVVKAVDGTDAYTAGAA